MCQPSMDRSPIRRGHRLPNLIAGGQGCFYLKNCEIGPGSPADARSPGASVANLRRKAGDRVPPLCTIRRYAAAPQPLADFLGLAHSRQHPVKLALDDAVAFACTVFQALAIEHADA